MTVVPSSSISQLESPDIVVNLLSNNYPLTFNITHKQAAYFKNLEFDLRYWKAQEGIFAGAPSEKYFFVPTNSNDSFRYSQLDSVKVYQGNYSQTMLLSFKSTENYYGLTVTVFILMFLLTSLLILYCGHSLLGSNLYKQLGVLGVNFCLFTGVIVTFSYF